MKKKIRMNKRPVCFLQIIFKAVFYALPSLSLAYYEVAYTSLTYS